MASLAIALGNEGLETESGLAGTRTQNQRRKKPTYLFGLPLANVWDSQVELAGSMVGDGSEVDEVFESPSHSLC